MLPSTSSDASNLLGLLFLFEFHPKHLPNEHLAIERDQRIQITAAAVYRFVQANQQDDPQKSQAEPPRPKQRGGDEQQDAHEFEGVAQLKGGLGEVCHGHKRHVEDHLGHQPAHLNGEIAQNQPCHYRKGIAQHGRGVEGCQLHPIDGEFHQEDLKKNGQTGIVLHRDEGQPIGDPRGVPDQQVPQRGEKKGDEEDADPQETEIGADERRKVEIVEEK